MLVLIAVPLLILLTLPAALIIPRFDPPPAMSSYGGTIWSGNARWLQAGQVPMRLTWRWVGWIDLALGSNGCDQSIAGRMAAGRYN